MKTAFKVITVLTFSLFINTKVTAQEEEKEDEKTSAKIEFVGNANIQKSLTSGDDIPANTGIGVIYTENLDKRFKALHSIEIELNINIASTVDTLKTQYDTSNNVINKSEFGNSILLPSNSGQAFGFRFKGYLTRQYEDSSTKGNKSDTTTDKKKKNLLKPVMKLKQKNHGLETIHHCLFLVLFQVLMLILMVLTETGMIKTQTVPSKFQIYRFMQDCSMNL